MSERDRAARRLRCAFASILWVACLGAAAARAQDLGAVEIQTRDLGDGIAMLVGRGGNLGVCAGPDGVLLVDDQFAPLTPKIRAAVSKLSPAPIRFVLNTHWHGDHTGGNENLAGVGAAIVAHRNVRTRMSADHVDRVLDRTIPASPAAALPVLTYEDGIRFHLNGHEIRVFHVASAHTDGDSIVQFVEADVLHLGDVYFNGFYPFIDTSSGGSVDGMLAAIDRGLALAGADTRIIPGHGPLSSREELRTYRDMLASIRDRVRRSIDAGRSVEQVLAERPTPEFDAEWGDGFLEPEVFVRTVYRSLER